MDPRDIIAAARTRLVRTLPYFSSPVMSLRPFPLDDLGTFGVDAESRMAYDPLRAAEWGVEYSTTIVLHEALHLNGDHFGRQGPREHELWNWACDISINQIVRDAGFGWPPRAKPLLPETYGFGPNLSPEEYYALLSCNPKAQQALQAAQQASANATGTARSFPGCGTPCGAGAGNPQGWEDRGKELSGGIEGQSKADAKLMRRSTAEKIVAAARKARGGRGIGTVPAGLQAWAQAELLPPVVPWQSVLAADLRTAIASKSGADDFTRSRISRRYWGLRQAWKTACPVMPALRSPKPEVAVVVDTSGSMTGGNNPPVLQAMSEVLGVVKAVGTPLRVYAVDAAVQAIARVVSARDIERLNKGGGGTDMCVGIAAAEKDRPDVIVLLTDGICAWPEPDKLPRAKLVVAVIGDAEVPSHIPRVVRVPVIKERVP